MFKRFTLALALVIGLSTLSNPIFSHQLVASQEKAKQESVEVAFVEGIPKFFDLLVDDNKNRLYGSDRAGGAVVVLDVESLETTAVISFGATTAPTGMSISIDGTLLAVALSGAGSIALIDTANLQITSYLYPQENTYSRPYDVRFGNANRLYSVGGRNGDYLEVFDSASRTHLASASGFLSAESRLAFSQDHNTLYVADTSSTPNQIVAFDVTADMPILIARTPFGAAEVTTFAVSPTSNTIYTSRGQIWSSSLQHTTGAFSVASENIEYVPSRERLFLSREETIVEVDAQNNFDVLGVRPVLGKAGVIRASTDGNKLYVSTDAGLEVIRLDVQDYQVSIETIGAGHRAIGAGLYNVGSVATLRTPVLSGGVHSNGESFGATFVGWVVDGKSVGWANPLTLTVNSSRSVQAIYAQTAGFHDVPSWMQEKSPITQLASRGTIRGYQNGSYGIVDYVRRDQMAALIARAMSADPGVPTKGILAPPDCLVPGTWDCEDWGNDFRDRGSSDPHLWRNAGTLQHYGVSIGYTGNTCKAKKVLSPCFGPGDPVTYAQTISFITRAMKVKGYWVDQPNMPLLYPLAPPEHHSDIRTYTFYVGSVTGPWFSWELAPTITWETNQTASWQDPVNRGWFAYALWAAVDSYWGTDQVYSDSRRSGGYVP